MNPPMGAPAIKIVKSVREQVSPEEWQVRVDLAAVQAHGVSTALTVKSPRTVVDSTRS